MNIAKRLGALESQAIPGAVVEKWHTISQLEHQSRDEAIDVYGRDQVGPDDSIIFLRSTSPRFDADGNMIFFKDWPENR